MKNRTQKNRDINTIRTFLYFFLFILSLFVLVMSVNVYKNFSKSIKSRDWIEVKDRLLQASIEENISPSSTSGVGSFKSITYRSKIIYEYEIGGRHYTNSRVSWTKYYDNGAMLTKAKELKRKFTNNLC